MPSTTIRKPLCQLFCAALLRLIVLWTLGGEAMAAEAALKPATLMPLWEPQAQFAGYYVALDKGIYAKHGIDLKILRAGPGHSPVDALTEGSADFAVLWLTTALQHRVKGTELLNLAQTSQRSSMLLVSKKSAGIESIADMAEKKVGLWEGDVSIPPRTLFALHHVDVRAIRQSHTVNLFLRGGIDVTSAMWFNEYHTIIDSGVDPDELNVIFLKDQGMNFLEDGIYALRKTLTADPELAAAFVQASLEGWRYAFEHAEEALDIVIKYMQQAHLPANRVHQQWMLARMRDLALPDDTTGRLGELREADYQAVAGTMQASGLIGAYPHYRDFVWRADGSQN